MKRSISLIYGAMLLSGGLGAFDIGARGAVGKRSTGGGRNNRQYGNTPPQRSNNQIKQDIVTSLEKVHKSIADYSITRLKAKTFMIQGFPILAINEKNAHKAVRAALASAGLNVEITKTGLQEALIEIDRRIDEVNRKLEENDSN